MGIISNMGEILEFKTDDLSSLKKLKNQLIEEYEEIEDQLFDLEDFMPDEDDKKEFALWEEEYKFLEGKLDDLESRIVELEEKIENA
jgi:predicted nuclease with TOPRIM domain